MQETIAMGKDDIERLIRRYFRQNYFQDPSLFSDIVIEGIKICEATAKGYWEIRTQSEIYRDKLAGVTYKDYERWVKHELLKLKTSDRKN